MLSAQYWEHIKTLEEYTLKEYLWPVSYIKKDII